MLLHDVVRAAAALRPRTLVDPREGGRWAATLLRTVVRVPAGLVVRAALTPVDVPSRQRPVAVIRHIA